MALIRLRFLEGGHCSEKIAFVPEARIALALAERLDGRNRPPVAKASITGNSVEIVEFPLSDAAAKLHSRSEFWRAVRRDGLCIHGLSLEQIVESVRA